jgi:hypothetical protein
LVRLKPKICPRRAPFHTHRPPSLLLRIDASTTSPIGRRHYDSIRDRADHDGDAGGDCYRACHHGSAGIYRLRIFWHLCMFRHPMHSCILPLEEPEELLISIQDYGALTACQGGYENCISAVYASTIDYKAVTQCYCSYGMDYLSCYSSWIYTQSCFSELTMYSSGTSTLRQQPLTSYSHLLQTGLMDTTRLGSKDFVALCRLQIKQPMFLLVFRTSTCRSCRSCRSWRSCWKADEVTRTIVNLSFASVKTTTAKGPQAAPSYTYTPQYKGTGQLLSGNCKSTQYTLLDIGTSVYWAAFVGCASDRPDCCPYSGSSFL